MIIDAILTILLAPIHWLLDTIPTINWPDWLSSAGPLVSGADTVGSEVGMLNKWLPVNELMAVVPFVLLAWGIHFAIKFVRILVSHVTGGGGAT